MLCVHWHNGAFSQSKSESALGNDSGIETFSSSVLVASWREREDSTISCYGPQAFFISQEMVMYFSISVSKLENKQEQSSTGKSCNPVFQTLVLVSCSLCAILFYKFTWNLESARTPQIPFLSWPLTKNCGIPWPVVFCSSFKGLTLH